MRTIDRLQFWPGLNLREILSQKVAQVRFQSKFKIRDRFSFHFLIVLAAQLAAC